MPHRVMVQPTLSYGAVLSNTWSAMDRSRMHVLWRAPGAYVSTDHLQRIQYHAYSQPMCTALRKWTVAECKTYMCQIYGGVGPNHGGTVVQNGCSGSQLSNHWRWCLAWRTCSSADALFRRGRSGKLAPMACHHETATRPIRWPRR